jgi:hypothetical protein
VINDFFYIFGCKNVSDQKIQLEKSGIQTEFKQSRTTDEVQGVSFRYGNVSFKGSQIDRKLSFAKLKKEFEKTKLMSNRQTAEVSCLCYHGRPTATGIYVQRSS